MATKATIATARKIIVSIAQKGAEVEALVGRLRTLQGMDFHAYENIRIDFVNAYCEARGVDVKDKAANAAARKGWSRLMAALGIKKPKSESEDAQRKRQARTAQRADKADKVDEGTPVAPTNGAMAVEKVKMELAPSEVHIIKLIRQHKLAAAIDFIHKLAETAEA